MARSYRSGNIHPLTFSEIVIYDISTFCLWCKEDFEQLAELIILAITNLFLMKWNSQKGCNWKTPKIRDRTVSTHLTRLCFSYLLAHCSQKVDNVRERDSRQIAAKWKNLWNDGPTKG